MDEAQLRTVWQQRQFNDRAMPLSQPIGILMKHTLAKRAKQLGQLSEIWDEVIPEEIAEHTALEGFHRSVLTVMVDSGPHRFQLELLLAGGLKKELKSRFPAAINKVRLVPGQFASIDVVGAKRYDL